MKKFILSFFYTVSFFILALPVYADTKIDLCPLDSNGQPSSFNPLCTYKFTNVFGTVITLVFILAVILALGYLIYGGIKWIMSGGDKAGVEGARNMIVASIVGLVIIFLSYFILTVVIGFFIKDFSLSNIVLPSLPRN